MAKRRGFGCVFGLAVALAASVVEPAAGAGSVAKVLPRPWPERTVARISAGYLTGGVIAPSGTSVVLEDADVGLAGFARLYQVSLPRGAVRRGSPVFAGAQLVRLGSSLAVTEARTEVFQPNGDEAPGSGGSGEEVRLLRASSAVVEAATYLPLGSVSVSAAAEPGEVWVGERGAVALVDLVHRSVLRSIALPGRSGSYDVSVSGGRLYALANAIGMLPIELDAVSTTAGKVVGSLGIPGVGGYPVAVPGGVWVSYRTGMLGTAELLSFPKLATKSPTPSAPNRLGEAPLPGSAQGMGIEVTVDGPVTFLSDILAVACVQTRTGKLIADASLPGHLSLDPIGAAANKLYAISGRSLVAIEAPAACRG